MLRIALATLALTMIAAPMLVLGVAAPTAEPDAKAPVLVSQDRVVALAKAQGIARISNIAFQEDTWIIQGADRDGMHMEVDVSSAGDVLNPVL